MFIQNLLNKAGRVDQFAICTTQDGTKALEEKAFVLYMLIICYRDQKNRLWSEQETYERRYNRRTWTSDEIENTTCLWILQYHKKPSFCFD